LTVKLIPGGKPALETVVVLAAEIEDDHETSSPAPARKIGCRNANGWEAGLALKIKG
jgi:hypothetical protein